MKTKLKKKKRPVVPSSTKEKVPVDYKEHWKGMPEFNAPGMLPIKSLIVNLYTKEDMHKFAKLTGQPITAKTKYINYPFIQDEPTLDKRYKSKLK